MSQLIPNTRQVPAIETNNAKLQVMKSFQDVSGNLGIANTTVTEAVAEFRTICIKLLEVVGGERDNLREKVKKLEERIATLEKEIRDVPIPSIVLCKDIVQG